LQRNSVSSWLLVAFSYERLLKKLAVGGWQSSTKHSIVHSTLKIEHYLYLPSFFLHNSYLSVMKSKLVLWGNDANDVKVLVALQLRPEDNKVDVWTFPVASVTDEFSRTMLHEWREGTVVEFPENHTHVERDLTGSILPDDLKVDKIDLVQRAQTEWHFLVLSHKLDAAYHSELAEMKDRIAKLENYDQNIWDELKGFWDKVRDQVSNRNLMREQADALRDNINGLFTQLKGMRSMVDDDFRQNSQTNFDKFAGKLGEIENRIKEQINTSDIFEELKRLQADFKEVSVSREFRFQIWDRIDSAFKAVKEKRFGSSYNSAYAGGSATERTSRRYDNLLVALEKMEESISRDKEDLKAQEARVAGDTVGQLEMQIAEAKMNMIKTRISSKEEKLEAMNLTKAELEGQKARAVARERYETTEAAAPTQEAPQAAVQEPAMEVAMEMAVETQAAPEPVMEMAAPMQQPVEEAVQVQEPVMEMAVETQAAPEPVMEMAAPMQQPAQEALVEMAAPAVQMPSFARSSSHPDDADAADLAF
jgi:hypothetical protein